MFNFAHVNENIEIMNYIKTLVLKYDTHLRQHEIKLFRGAIVAEPGNSDDILFHDHDGDGLRYAYPLIQYKTIDSRAAIVAVGEGTDSLARMTYPFTRELTIGTDRRPFTLVQSMACSTDVEFTDTPLKYSISQWLPLNNDNYREYAETNDISLRLDLLKRMLVGNILSFAKGIGLHLDDQVEVALPRLPEAKPVTFKAQKMLSFNATFTVNLRLPSYIGLGKGSSIGYGTIRSRGI